MSDRLVLQALILKAMTQERTPREPIELKPQRYPLFDSLRGFAMILMAIYHFSFDLNQFGVISFEMNHDWRWTSFRAVIMSLFMSLIGVGLYLGRASYGSSSYCKRILTIAACALIISLVTSFQFPKSWIFFGVLHFATLVMILGPLLIRAPWLNLMAGASIIVVQFLVSDISYSALGWNLLGLSPIRPYTEDFAPIVPWLGVSMIGLFIGYAVKTFIPRLGLAEWKPLTRLGHHSLLFYMLHQVVLYPLAYLISRL